MFWVTKPLHVVYRNNASTMIPVRVSTQLVARCPQSVCAIAASQQQQQQCDPKVGNEHVGYPLRRSGRPLLDELERETKKFNIWPTPSDSFPSVCACSRRSGHASQRAAVLGRLHCVGRCVRRRRPSVEAVLQAISPVPLQARWRHDAKNREHIFGYLGLRD